MLLPVFFITGRCLYVTFNQNAKDSWSGDYGVTYKYQSNVPFHDDDIDIDNGNIYAFNYNDQSILLGSDIWLDFRVIRGSIKFDFSDGLYIDEYMNNITISDRSIRIVLFNSSENYDTSSVLTIYLGDTNNDEYLAIVDELSDILITTSEDCIILMNECIINDLGLDREIVYRLTYTDYNEILSVESEATLDNAFIYSVNQLNEVPLFSWAKTSFLVAPFQYIGALFGVPNDSPITTLMSYWLDISIIWLVFDLIMYVPLLVHRWLDKGVLE